MEYKHHIVSDIRNKPLLHKKGKQWVVVTLSALVLGLGVSATKLSPSANNVQAPQIHSTQVAPSQPSKPGDQTAPSSQSSQKTANTGQQLPKLASIQPANSGKQLSSHPIVNLKQTALPREPQQAKDVSVMRQAGQMHRNLLQNAADQNDQNWDSAYYPKDFNYYSYQEKILYGKDAHPGTDQQLTPLNIDGFPAFQQYQTGYKNGNYEITERFSDQHPHHSYYSNGVYTGMTGFNLQGPGNAPFGDETIPFIPSDIRGYIYRPMVSPQSDNGDIYGGFRKYNDPNDNRAEYLGLNSDTNDNIGTLHLGSFGWAPVYHPGDPKNGYGRDSTHDNVDNGYNGMVTTLSYGPMSNSVIYKDGDKIIGYGLTDSQDQHSDSSLSPTNETTPNDWNTHTDHDEGMHKFLEDAENGHFDNAPAGYQLSDSSKQQFLTDAKHQVAVNTQNFKNTNTTNPFRYGYFNYVINVTKPKPQPPKPTPKPQPKNVLTHIYYMYNGQKVGDYPFVDPGPANQFDDALYEYYANLNNPQFDNYVPSGYTLPESNIRKFQNYIYPPSGYVNGRFNHGQVYYLDVVKPATNKVTYTYNGQVVGSWTSPSQGAASQNDQDFIHYYENISSDNAPGLPSQYFIPSGPTYDHPEYNNTDNPLNNFFNIYDTNTDVFDYGRNYTIPVDVPYSALHIKYYENGQPAQLPEQVVAGKIGDSIDLSLINKIQVPSGYHLQRINPNNNTKFLNNSQRVDVYLVSDKTNTVTKTKTVIKNVPGPTKYVTKNVPGPTKYITKNVPGPTKYITKNIPGPTKYVTKKVPGPTQYVTKTVQVPGPTKYITKTVQVPGPTKTITKTVKVPGPVQYVTKKIQVPGPTKYVTKRVPVPGPIQYVTKTITKNVPGKTKYVNVPGPTKTITKNVPGPTKYVTKNVPGPTKYVNVPGPTKTITKTIVKTVKVPGQTQVIHEPGKTITKVVKVPGPVQIKNVPGPTITKIVKVPGPTQVVYRTVTKNVPGPVQYVKVPCHCKVINHTKIVYVPKVVKVIVTPKKHINKPKHKVLPKKHIAKKSEKVVSKKRPKAILKKHTKQAPKKHSVKPMPVLIKQLKHQIHDVRHYQKKLEKPTNFKPVIHHSHKAVHKLPQTGDTFTVAENAGVMLMAIGVLLKLMWMMAQAGADRHQG